MLAKIVATAALAATAFSFAPAPASAATRTVYYYRLTAQERQNACGDFQGTIIFSDGSSLDCSNGLAEIPAD